MRTLTLILILSAGAFAQAWETNLDRARDLAKSQGKPIFAHVFDDF